MTEHIAITPTTFSLQSAVVNSPAPQSAITTIGIPSPSVAVTTPTQIESSTIPPTASPDVICDATVVDWLSSQAIPLQTTEASAPLDDLSPLKAIIGPARLVGLGEATHGTHEFTMLKQRIFEYLVKEMGFKALILEAQWAEVAAMNQYIQTGEGNSAELLDTFAVPFLDWVFNTQEILNLVEWMRKFNQTVDEASKIQLYGMDMQTIQPALDAVREYLLRVDPQEQVTVTSRLACFSRFSNNLSALERYQWAGPDTQEQCRQDLQAVQDEMVQNRAGYIQNTSEQEIDFILQSLRIVQQAEQLYRHGYESLGLLRDQFMAENVEWILQNLGEDGKAVVWAHNVHLAATESIINDLPVKTLGKYLREQYGSEWFSFAFTFFNGSFNAVLNGMTEPEAQKNPRLLPNSVEACLHQLGIPIFLLNFLREPDDSTGSQWMHTGHWLRAIGGMYNPKTKAEDYSQWIVLPEVFDGLIYVDETTATQIIQK